MRKFYRSALFLAPFFLGIVSQAGTIPESLRGEWLLVEYGGKTPEAVKNKVSMTAIDGAISYHDGCNSFDCSIDAVFDVKKEELTTKSSGCRTTMKYCRVSQELQIFWGDIGAAVHTPKKVIVKKGSPTRLELTGPSGKSLAFEVHPAPQK